MKKSYLIAMAMLGISGMAQANEVSASKALEIARDFVGTNSVVMSATSSADAKSGGLKVLRTVRNQADTRNLLYVIENEQNNGYVIVSASDATRSVLGYSNEGSYDQTRGNSEMEWWLGEYAEQIEAVESALANDAAATKAAKAASNVQAATYAPVEPLLGSMQWTQESPFNLKTPTYVNSSGDTVHCYAGCLMVSVGMVMRYWQWPLKGTGSHTIWGTSLSSNFAEHTYDWSLMPTTITASVLTDEVKEQCSTLMLDLGISLDATYNYGGNGATAAYVTDVPLALTRYFSYATTATEVLASSYTTDEWSELMRTEVQEGRPVVYGCTSKTAGGHSVVLDGMDADGLFHINWGWGGRGATSNGYYELTAFNPTAVPSLAYNYNHDAIIGIKPNNEYNASVEAPAISLVGQSGTAFSGTAQVQIEAAAGTVYYTTNGDLPTSESTKYTEPFTISKGVKVRAIAVSATGTASEVTSVQFSRKVSVADIASAEIGEQVTIDSRITVAQSVALPTAGDNVLYAVDGSAGWVRIDATDAFVTSMGDYVVLEAGTVTGLLTSVADPTLKLDDDATATTVETRTNYRLTNIDLQTTAFSASPNEVLFVQGYYNPDDGRLYAYYGNPSDAEHYRGRNVNVDLSYMESGYSLPDYAMIQILVANKAEETSNVVARASRAAASGTVYLLSKPEGDQIFTAVDDIEVAEASVSVNGSVISIAGGTGTVYNVAGAVVGRGEQVSVAPGAYIVKTATGAVRVVVK